MKYGVIWKLVFWLALFSSARVFAAETAPPAPGPHDVISEVTEKLMSLSKNSSLSLKDDPQKYFDEVRVTLEPVVSFNFIAKNVMASYWGDASTEQKKKFIATFTQSMVETLGKGLANFTDLKVTTLPPKGDISAHKKVQVRQEVLGPDGTSKISYTMARYPTGEWKLINVVLNGVNLGTSFREQFVQAMKQNDNNIDKVIENWAKQG